MTEYNHEPRQDSLTPEPDLNDETFSSGPNPDGARKIAVSILAGCVIIAASVIYNAQAIVKKLDSMSGSNILAGTSETAAPAAPQAAAPAAPGGPVNITLKPGTPYQGNPNARVTVAEYADYQCPFCEQFFKTVMPDLQAKYISTGKIKFVYQDFAFLGPDSFTAAQAAHCAADQNKFWQYHDYLFSHQGQEGSGWAAADRQKQFAQSLGLNTAQFNQCLDGNKYQQEVQDETSAGKSYGVTATPTVFVNGNIIVGAQPASAFEQAIEQALKQ